MEVASDIGAWVRCHPRPSFFGGMDQIPATKIDKSTSTINKFDLGHKNHEKTDFLRQPNLSTNLQKKSTDQQTNLVFWDTDLKFVNVSTNFKSVDLSILPAILECPRKPNLLMLICSSVDFFLQICRQIWLAQKFCFFVVFVSQIKFVDC